MSLLFPAVTISLAIFGTWVYVDYVSIARFLIIVVPILALISALIGPMIKVHSWLPKSEEGNPYNEY